MTETPRDTNENLAAEELRRLLHAADETIVVPPGLWDNVRRPQPAPARPRPRRQWLPVTAAAAVLVGIVVAFAAGVLAPPSATPPAAPPNISISGQKNITTKVESPTEFRQHVGHGCPEAGHTTPASTGTITPCFIIDRNGTHVEVVVAATVAGGTVSLQECIGGPGGIAKTIGCSPRRYVVADRTFSMTWTSRASVPSGQYCASIEQFGPQGTQTTTVTTSCAVVK